MSGSDRNIIEDLLVVPPPLTCSAGELKGFEETFASFVKRMTLGESKALVTWFEESSVS